MPKIICEWTTCKHNSAATWKQDAGECTLCSVYMKHIDDEDKIDNPDEVMEGLQCKQYEWDKKKPCK